MNKKAVLSMALLVALNLSTQARSEKRMWPALLGNLRFGLYMAENNLFEARLILSLKAEIGLTPAQEQKIEDMMLANEEATIRRASDIKVLELKFAALLKGNRIDRRAMEDMARTIGKLKTDLQVDHINYLLDVRDALTAEQIQKIEKLKKDLPQRLREKLREHGGRGRYPPPPLPAPGRERRRACRRRSSLIGSANKKREACIPPLFFQWRWSLKSPAGAPERAREAGRE